MGDFVLYADPRLRSLHRCQSRKPCTDPALTVRIRERFLSFPSSARLQARRERSPGEAFPAYPKFVAYAGESAGHPASY